MDELMQRVVALAKGAGERIMPFYRRAMIVKAKEDKSPLTEADMASHDYLIEELKGLLPGTPVISEESESRDAGENAGQFWLVDPLDGTKEFLKGTNEFTVNIALVKGGRAVMGAVHAPALGLTYYASPDGGAWREVGEKSPERVKVRPADLEHLAIVASKDHAGPLVTALLARFPTATSRSMGSSLKFCLVAEGSADIYLRDVPTMEWDTAAAQCVVEAAGGNVCSLDGEPLHYGKVGLKNPAIMTVGDLVLTSSLTELCAAL